MANAKLRPLDVTRVMEDGQPYMSLRDPEGHTDKLMLLSALDALIAARFTGRMPNDKIAAEVSRQTGLDIDTGRVARLASALDENLMLDSPRFRKHVSAIVENFRAAQSRPAHLAGRSYPADRASLKADLDGYFELEGAPGTKIPAAAPLTGLVSPHIDYSRGRIGYAWAYREALRSGLADLYVILGVAHQTPPTPFVLTHKNFETPFGPARTDSLLAEALKKDARFDPFADELVHRTEHSVEFQAVYLAYARERLGGDFKILPILASSCDLVGNETGKRTEHFIDALAKRLSDYKGRICLLAGVDFFHIGPCFGDPDLSPERLARAKKQDAASMDRLLDKDPGGFLDSVMQDGNERRVCGVSALYAFSRLDQALFPKSKGEALHYAHAADPTGGEVGFAAMAFR